MGILYNDNWHVASVFDQAGNVVQFNTLIGGETGFEMEPINQEYTAGDYQSGERNALMLASAEFDGAAQIADWVEQGTPVAAVALSRGLNGRNYRWAEYLKLSEKLNNPKAARSEGDGFLKVMLQNFDVNPVRVRNLIQDAGGTSIVLPISGETLTLAAEDGGAFDLTLNALDYSDVQLDTVTASFNNERGSVELTLPSNTWKVTWDLDGATQASLRADGSTEYVAG